MSERPNILFVLADQLREASVLGGITAQAHTPHLDVLAERGRTFTNAVSPCPVCTPYRAMLLTGRHPQTTGHLVNFVETRADEISIADTLARGGYRTGYVGKWHLGVGQFPGPRGGADYIPEGRSRLGFEYFRAYNFHYEYDEGFLSLDDWRVEKWRGYETEGLCDYSAEFLGMDDSRPFCLFVAPHQPHIGKNPPYAPERFYAALPDEIHLPANVADADKAAATEMQRHYLAMIAAVDEMLGTLLTQLERSGHADNTLVVFTSDHGTMGGAHGFDPWCKKLPYEESVHVPMVVRLPGDQCAGTTCDEIFSPVDFFPTFCRVANASVPAGLEGMDLSGAIFDEPAFHGRDGLLTMNFAWHPDFLIGADDPRHRPHYQPWRGVRTRQHHFIRWLDGHTALFDLAEDPLQLNNLVGNKEHAPLSARLDEHLDRLLREREDSFEDSPTYANWLDDKRRIVRNSSGSLPHPDSKPDWSRFPADEYACGDSAGLPSRRIPSCETHLQVVER